MSSGISHRRHHEQTITHDVLSEEGDEDEAEHCDKSDLDDPAVSISLLEPGGCENGAASVSDVTMNWREDGGSVGAPHPRMRSAHQMAPTVEI